MLAPHASSIPSSAGAYAVVPVYSPHAGDVLGLNGLRASSPMSIVLPSALARKALSGQVVQVRTFCLGAETAMPLTMEHTV
jgi:hypothetical protein